jgi:hypothetical protein
MREGITAPSASVAGMNRQCLSRNSPRGFGSRLVAAPAIKRLKESICVKKKAFARKLVLNRETLTNLEMKGVAAAGNTNVSCSCGIQCSDVSVCSPTIQRTVPLCQ